MSRVLSDFVNNPVLFFTSFLLVLVGLIVILVSMLKTSKKVKVEEQVKTVEEKFPQTYTDTKKTDIESVLEEMQRDLDNSEAQINTFEDEQEEKSIISYQELLQTMKVEEPVVEDNQVKQFVDKIKGATEEKKFKGSEFISPIYGRVEAPTHIEKPNTPIIRATKKQPEIETLDFDFDEPKHAYDIEKTLNLEPIRKEIKQNDDFLKALKEFRKNLE